MIIGYTYDNYATRRLIIEKVPGICYKKVWDKYTIMRLGIIPLNRLGLKGRFNDIYLQYNDYKLNNVDILHLYNAINYNNKPWIVSFEHIIPHFRCMYAFHLGKNPSFAGLDKNRKYLKGIKALAGSACKKIIALSHCNAGMEVAMLEMFPEYKKEINDKLIVMHPPQKPEIDDIAVKSMTKDNKINIIFVGHAFFNKGGRELLDCFINLRKYNYPAKLIIISSLFVDNYASFTNDQDVLKAKSMIKSYPDMITWYPKLPNRQVIELMKKSHIGVLPTYADTFGFSVLEMQASGCPVITTNVRALPEINDEEKGWIINVPINQLGEAIYTTAEERQHLSDRIRRGLEEIIHEIFADPSVIWRKGEKALADIKKNHSPENYSKKMAQIYQEALG